MGQQYLEHSRDCALQNRFTAYLQTALKRKKYNYTQRQMQQKDRELLTDFQAVEFTGDLYSIPFGSGWDHASDDDIALISALAALSVRERFILFNRVLGGSGYDELAKALGLRYSGASSAYHRIIKKLRNELGGGMK